jgi:hypothetical protein
VAFSMSLIDRKARTYSVTALLAGVTVPLSGSVDLGLVAPTSKSPTSATTWTSVSYTAGSFSVLFAAPQASSTAAIVVPGDADLWMRITNAPEIAAVKIERITILGGGTSVLPATLDALVAALLADRTSATYARAVALPTYPNGA